MNQTFKKVLALVLASIMVLALAACNAAPAAGSSAAPSTDPGSNEPTSDEIYTVKLKYTAMVNIPNEEGQKKIEDAISKHIQSLGYNLALDMEIVPIMDYATTLPLQLSSGEKMDIVFVANMTDWVSNGYMVPLDDYLDNDLKPTAELVGNWIDASVIGGKTYAVPAHKGLVLTWKYIYDESYVNAINYDMSKVTDFYSLVDLFAALKKANPDKIIEADTSRYPALFREMKNTSLIGPYVATVGDDTKLNNYFETEAFKEAVEWAYKFRQEGYTSPEGSTSTVTADSMVNSGATIGVTMAHGQNEESIGIALTASNTYGGTFKSVEIEKGDLANPGLNWGIAYTSENPKAAAQMLNLLWTDEFVINSMIYGLEGESWVWNEDKTSIKYPDGLDAATVPYTTILTCGAFSDQFKMYPFEGNSTPEDLVYMKESIDKAWAPPLFGFIPDGAKVSTQLAAIANVYNQYYNALAYGDVDPASYVPEFVAALKAAGIDEVIAEYQAQADAWLANK